MTSKTISPSGRAVKVDYTGHKLGKLTVLGLSEKSTKKTLFWKCQCDCGKISHVRTTGLSKGTKSCGCLGKRHFKDVTGEKRNMLTFINYFGKNIANNNTWRVRCDCGKELICEYSDVNTGKIKSCGCLKTINAKKVNSLPFGEASFNQVYSYYKNSAKERNIPFELDKDFFRYTTGKNCYYCNSEPENTKISMYNNGHYLYNGIDRVDNNKGYIESNVLPCCKTCNFAKRSMGIEEFKKWISRLVDRFNVGYKDKQDIYTITDMCREFQFYVLYGPKDQK